MKSIELLLLLFMALFLLGAMSPETVKVKRQVRTVYDINGRVVNQAQDAKGFHRVSGSTKLVAGVDTVTLNSGTVNGKQDISFTGAGTYWGRAWSLTPTNDSTYKVVPISGTQFLIKSSGGTDTATVNFVVEGE